MRKLVTLLGIFVALAIPAAALAATLDTGRFTNDINSADKCAHGAFYHIVNPQSGGQDGTLTMVFSNETKTVNSYKSPGNTTHYLVFSTGKVVSAEDNLGGFLNISDWSCKT
jgi:hypothetical protein